MKYYVIVIANAGMSGNFLMRLLNFSRNITWDRQESQRSDDLVSKIADNQFINYCWTSNCHTAVMATTHRLAHTWYKQKREMLDMETWHAIKQGTNRPTAWFFHEVSAEVKNDPETIIVQVQPGDNFNIQMLIDRWCFNGEAVDFNNNYADSYDWFRNMLTTVNTLVEQNYNESGADIIINNTDIFDIVKVLELMKDLDLYHNGLREVISDWIKVYLLKNVRPSGLFSKSSPTDYMYKEEIDQIKDPYIKHILKCVNRKVWPTLDLIDDPYIYIEDFRKHIQVGNKFGVSFDLAQRRFKDWQMSVEV